MTRYGQCPTPAFDITPVLFGKYGIESRPVGHNTSFYSASAVLTDRWRNPFPLQRPRAEFVPPSAVDPLRRLKVRPVHLFWSRLWLKRPLDAEISNVR
jgi:hypothetical protein